MKLEDIYDDLWLEFADTSDGWETTMSFEAFKKAIIKAREELINEE